MSQEDVYILSLNGINDKFMYVGEHGPTSNLGDAKIFTSKFQVKLNRIFNEEYRWWNIICYSKKSIFMARLKGK